MDKTIHGGRPHYMYKSRNAFEDLHAFVLFRACVGPHLLAILPPLRRYITTAPSHPS